MSNPIVRVGDIELTPEEAAEKARSLLGVMYGALDPMMTVKIIKTLEGQAANGDHKAQQMYFDLLGRGVPEPSHPPVPGNVVQVNVGADQKERVGVLALDPMDMAVTARVLALRGPLMPAVLEDECNLLPGRVEAMIATGFLEQTKTGQVKLIELVK